MRQLRGFKFDGLDLSGEARALAGQAGLAVTPAGRLGMASDAEVVRQAILLLLTTMPGERVMRPDYGCPLHRLMFAPNDATTAGLAIHYVRQALTKWEPRIEILRIDAGPAADAGQLIITLEYRLRASGRRDHLELALDLQGPSA